jgi:hypothetical protein
LDGLATAVNSKQFFPVSELIVRSFDSPEGNLGDVLGLVGLLNSPEVDARARADLLALINLERSPLAAFHGVSSWKSD